MPEALAMALLLAFDPAQLLGRSNRLTSSSESELHPIESTDSEQRLENHLK